MTRIRRRRSGTIPTFGLAFLDLLSCAFGAVIILAVIVSASASQRARVQSLVAVVDAELALSEADAATASLDQYPFTITIAGPRWTGTWQDGRTVTPVIAELTQLNAVASCVPDARCFARHQTVTGRGIEPGRYRIAVFGHRGTSQAIEGKPLKLVVRAYYDGVNVLEQSETFVLRDILQQGDGSTLWFGHVDFHPAVTER